MKRTRKWQFVEQEATRLANIGLSPREIAKRLEVSKSSVTRWMQDGKLPKTAAKAANAAQVVAAAGQSPADWAKTVRDAYSLDATDDQLVTLAEEALTEARDTKHGVAARMTASRTFQALVRQLALVARNATTEQPSDTPVEEPKNKPAPRAVRRPGADPRKLLMVVK